MFERYTEKARRVIFFSRYEASRYGSPDIDTEHLLLGILREYHELSQLLPAGAGDAIRTQIDARTPKRKSISTSVDLPLNNAARRALAYGAEEADRLAHRWIWPEHLLLGLLREEGCLAAQMLRERGVAPEKLREHYAKQLFPETRKPPRLRDAQPIKIHGLKCNAELIRDRVRVLQQTNWHWEKRPWKALDIVIDEDRKLSFDIALAEDAKKFELRRGGWKTDKCGICEWELCESSDNAEHATGYTNGRDWVCTECFAKFLEGPDYFTSAYSEIT
ncbi:MAG: Clp protease N-terminal domain-containing protein [Terriglobales bacterium]